MRHYAAKQREEDGRWDFAVSWGKHASPVGYCAGYREYSEDDLAVHDAEHAERLNAEQEPFREKYHTDGHETPEEARACYKEYLLDQDLRLSDGPEDPRTLRRCKADGCGQYTAGTAALMGTWFWHLCGEHRNRETVAGLFDVGEMWTS